MTGGSIRVKEVGRVRRVKRDIAEVSGLLNFMSGQILTFAGGSKGFIIGFERGNVLALVLGGESPARIGAEVYSQSGQFTVPVGDGFLGRVVNALGETADGKGPAAGKSGVEMYPVFRDAPSTMDRAEVSGCLETGTKIVDGLIPVALGQRQLIIGDRITGKTAIALDAIARQKDTGVFCVYCCIGKSHSSVVKAVAGLKSQGALKNTVIVMAAASAGAGEQYLAPYTACAYGEYFMRTGRNALVVFDDMTKHAWAYRQISLLLERSPGREAYPGDIYYAHSSLMERAGKLCPALGGGSMTFMPVIETLEGDTAGYIPSNMVSMTDGQIYLSSSLFAGGFKPAIDFLQSVSTLGGRVQNPAVRQLAKNIRLEYLQYKELSGLTKLKAGLTVETERRLKRGEAIMNILAQDKNCPSGRAELIVLLYALHTGVLDGLSAADVDLLRRGIMEHIRSSQPGLENAIAAARELPDGMKKSMQEAFKTFFIRQRG